MQTIIERPELFLDSMSRSKALIHSIIDCPKPIIAKVNGAAIGLGATIALFCDLIIAANHAKIADPHVKVGFAAGDGGAVIWPQLIGYARAKEYLLLGDTLTGEEAARIGLINKGGARRATRRGRRWVCTTARRRCGTGDPVDQTVDQYRVETAGHVDTRCVHRLRGTQQRDQGPPGSGQRVSREATTSFHG